MHAAVANLGICFSFFLLGPASTRIQLILNPQRFLSGYGVPSTRSEGIFEFGHQSGKKISNESDNV